MEISYATVFLLETKEIYEDISRLCQLLSDLGSIAKGSGYELSELTQMLARLAEMGDNESAEKYYHECWRRLSLLQANLHHAVIKAYQNDIEKMLSGIDDKTISNILHQHTSYTGGIVAYSNRQPKMVRKLKTFQFKPAAEDLAQMRKDEIGIENYHGMVQVKLPSVIREHDAKNKVARREKWAARAVPTVIATSIAAVIIATLVFLWPDGPFDDKRKDVNAPDKYKNAINLSGKKASVQTSN